MTHVTSLHPHAMPSLSPLTLVLTFLAVAWAQFAFVSERTNPFRRPAAPLPRRSWRLGRRLALGVLGGGVSASVAHGALGASLASGLALGAMAYALIAIPSLIAYRTRDRLWEAAPTDADAKSDVAAPPVGDAAAPDVAPARDSLPDRSRLRDRPVDIVV